MIGRAVRICEFGIIICPQQSHCMLLLHHGFTILLTGNPKVLLEISLSTLVFTKVLTVFTVKSYCGCVFSFFVVVMPTQVKNRCPVSGTLSSSCFFL